MSNGWSDEETFNCWLPAQAVVMKSGKNADGSDKEGRRWIQGIASTNARDLQQEVVDQHGIDYKYFLKHGYFNDDHKAGHDNKVGEPTECKITKNGMWVKGYLFPDNKAANGIWGLMNSLNKTGSNRKVGFSIQGKVKRRQGGVIKECWIQDVAITPAPVNTTTWAEIAKSLSEQKWDLSKDKEDKEEKEEKAVSAGGSPLVPESLEGTNKEDRTDKSLTYDETVAYLEQSEDLPNDVAKSVASAIFSIL